MTRLEFADLLRLSFGVESQDYRASMDDRVLWRMGDVVRGKLIFDYIQATQAKGEFVRGVVLPVQKDQIRNLQYITIGSAILNMPNNEGFVSVGLVQGDDTPFTIINAGQRGIASGLECENIGTVAWQEGERIYLNDLHVGVNEVLVIGIPSIASLTDDEHIPIPFTVQDTWFDEVKKKFIPQMPEDKIRDTRQEEQ